MPFKSDTALFLIPAYIELAKVYENYYISLLNNLFIKLIANIANKKIAKICTVKIINIIYGSVNTLNTQELFLVLKRQKIKN